MPIELIFSHALLAIIEELYMPHPLEIHGAGGLVRHDAALFWTALLEVLEQAGVVAGLADSREDAGGDGERRQE